MAGLKVLCRTTGGQRPSELAQIACRFRFVETVVRGPAVGGQVQSSEDRVEEGKLSGEIAVVRSGVPGVMPVVKLRGGRQPPQRAQIQVHVGVDENRLQRYQDDERTEADLAEAQRIQRQHRG